MLMLHGSHGTYAAMYAFDNWYEPTDYYGVAWPAQNMPVEFFGSSYPWSISMGKEVDKSAVKVTLIRQSDQKKWAFSIGGFKIHLLCPTRSIL